MNKRIKNLAASHFPRDTDGNISVTPEIIEEFAKAIVQECVGVVEGGRFLHGDAPTARFARECSSAIKRHFGVE